MSQGKRILNSMREVGRNIAGDIDLLPLRCAGITKMKATDENAGREHVRVSNVPSRKCAG
jgi:hypothetical protein